MANPKGNPQNLVPIPKGTTLNPGGKPVNARNTLTKRFLTDLLKDFEENGKSAIAACRQNNPDRYVSVVASLVPKELIIEKPTEQLSDDELSAAINELREMVARVEGAGAGTGATPFSESASYVSPLSKAN